MTDFQTRIAAKHDNMRRKVIDRNMEMLGHVVDCIRIKERLNKEGDIEARIVEEADIVHLVFPPLTDVPIRELKKDNGKYSITSLPTAVGAGEQQPLEMYKIQAPRHEKIYVGDLIFRIFIEPDNEFPIVLGLKITEKLGTFGTNSLISNSFHCAIYTQELPQKIIDVIAEMAKRRLYLNY